MSKWLGHLGAKTVFWYLFNAVVIGVLVLNMIPATYMAILVYGDISLGILIFFPNAKFVKLFGIDGSEMSKREHNIFKMAVAAYVMIPVVLMSWNPFVSYLDSLNGQTVNSYEQLISTATATIEIYVKGNTDSIDHDSNNGGYLKFIEGQNILLGLYGLDSIRSSGTKDGEGGYIAYTAKVNMYAYDIATKEKVNILRQAEYAEVQIKILPTNIQIDGGRVAVTINNDVRIDISIPAQLVDKDYIIIPDIQQYIR